MASSPSQDEIAALVAQTLGSATQKDAAASGLLDNTAAGVIPPDDLTRLLDTTSGGAGFSYGEAPSFFGGFIKTAFHGGTSGLLGRDAHEAFWDPEAVARFQIDHPLASLAAEILGSAPVYAIPYLGEERGVSLGLEAAKRLPGLSRLAAFATSPEVARARPLVSAAAREVARIAPLEIARVAGAALDISAPGTVPKVLGQIAMELPMFAAFGGAAKALRSSLPQAGRAIGQEQELQKAFDFYNLEGTLQERLRQSGRAREILREKLGLPPGAVIDEALGHPASTKNFDDVIAGVQSKLVEAIKAEEPSAGNALVRELRGDSGRFTTKKLNDLLRAGKGKGGNVEVQLPVLGSRGFASRQEVDAALQAAGITDGNIHYVQHPRVVTVKTEAGAQRVEGALQGPGFSRVGVSGRGQGTWIAEEKDGGYIVAKRIAGEPSARARRAAGKRGVPDYTGKYVFFRTDRPLEFNPRAAKMHDALLSVFRPLRPLARDPAEKAIPVMRMVRELEAAHPLPEELLGVPKRAVWNYIEGRTSPEFRDALEAIGRRVDHFGSELKRVLSPGLVQFSQSKRAMRLNSIVRAAFNKMNLAVEVEFAGAKVPTKAKTLIGQLVEVPEFGKSTRDMLEKLNDRGMAELSYTLVNELSPGEATQKGFQREVVELLRHLNRNDKIRTAESVAIQNLAREHGLLAGVDEFVPLEFHYGITKTWRGNFRHEILNEEGKVVGYGSGYTAADAKREAEAIITAAKATGTSSTGLSLGRFSRIGNREEDLANAVRIDEGLQGVADVRRARSALAINPPEQQLHLRGEALGSIGSVRPFTKAELKDILLSNIIATRRANLNTALRIATQDELVKLQSEFPELAKDLIQRINQRAGRRVPGGISEIVEKGVDKVLAPVLGTNSASKIAHAVNQGMFTLTLGLFDMGFAAINAVTPVMTSMPEVAWLMTAPPERVSKYYSSLLGVTREGGARSFYSLDPLRTLAQGLQRLVKPQEGDIALFERALQEHIIDPKFVEEFTGSATRGVYGAEAAKDGWAKWLYNLSNFPAAKSEEFSRGLTFMMGIDMGEKFWGLEGERLFQFGREFVEHTQYLYTAADRPRILTGPLGQIFGLFKNWGMHQIASLSKYHGEAFLDGNIAPLLWTGVGIGAVGGVGALPWFTVADNFSRLVSGKGVQQNIYETMGYDPASPSRYFIDGLYYGLPSLMNVSLQARGSAISANPMHDIAQLTSIAAWDRAQWIGDFLGSSLNYATATGKHPVTSREVMDKFVRATAPRTFYRFISTTQDNALRSLKTQGRLVGPLTFSQRAAYTLGMTPLEIDKYFSAADEAWRSTDARRNAVDTLGAALADAQLSGDVGSQNAALGQALRAGVLDSVVRSASSRVRIQTEDQMDRQLKDAASQVKRRAIGAP